MPCPNFYGQKSQIPNQTRLALQGVMKGLLSGLAAVELASFYIGSERSSDAGGLETMAVGVGLSPGDGWW